MGRGKEAFLQAVSEAAPPLRVGIDNSTVVKGMLRGADGALLVVDHTAIFGCRFGTWSMTSSPRCRGSKCTK